MPAVQFIINPCSGRNRRRPWLAEAVRDFSRTHVRDGSVTLTEAPGHATAIARDVVRGGCELVVAIGGDGTMNEIAQAVTNTPATLALVPCGSGNGLALHLGLPRRLQRALQLTVDEGRRVAAIDTGAVNGRSFFNAMGLGFDAEVSRRFNGLTRRGLPAYVRAGWSVLRAARSERCTIVSGSRRTTLDTLLIAVANSDQYGNNAKIAPGAQVDDGMLDLVAIKSTGFLALAGLLPGLFLGNLDQSRHVARRRGTSFTIQRAAAGLIHTDGETHETGATITVQVIPRSLRILVPATSRVSATPVALDRGSFALQFP